MYSQMFNTLGWQTVTKHKYIKAVLIQGSASIAKWLERRSSNMAVVLLYMYACFGVVPTKCFWSRCFVS